MIRIGKSIKELIPLAETFYNKVVKKIDPESGIDSKLRIAQRRGDNAKIQFLDFLKSNLKELITYQPNELESLVLSGLPLYKTAMGEHFHTGAIADLRTSNISYKNEILDIFNYKSFSGNTKWAYEHSSNLDANICPYCNSQFIFTVNTKNGKTRPQFDHFLSKNKYPYAALSFFNLIPSCAVCNTSIKTSKDFKLSTHIHPFIEGTEDCLKFSVQIDSVDFLAGKKFKIGLKKDVNSLPDKLNRAKRSARDLIIEERYDNHLEYVGELILKCHVYNHTQVKELLQNYRDQLTNSFLFENESDIIEMLFGNGLKQDELHKRILSKLTNNILDEFGIKMR